jgi:hypothetical protein
MIEFVHILVSTRFACDGQDGKPITLYLFLIFGNTELP